MTVRGGCRCGAVRYTLSLDALPPTYACHCLDCQTWSGSAFGLHALLPRDAVALTGPIAVYAHEGQGGFTSEQRVCGTCHARIFNSNTALPEMIVLRAGTLDSSDGLDPIAHIWTSRKQPWLALPKNRPTWSETPTGEEFAAALDRSKHGS